MYQRPLFAIAALPGGSTGKLGHCQRRVGVRCHNHVYGAKFGYWSNSHAGENSDWCSRNCAGANGAPVRVGSRSLEYDATKIADFDSASATSLERYICANPEQGIWNYRLEKNCLRD